MSILGIQIAGVLFALIMLYLTFLHQRRKEFTINESILWLVLWLAFAVVVLFPTIFDFFIKDLLNLERRLDFYIIIGFMFLIGVSFHNYLLIRKTQNMTEKVVREIAFQQNEKKTKKK